MGDRAAADRGVRCYGNFFSALLAFHIIRVIINGGGGQRYSWRTRAHL